MVDQKEVCISLLSCSAVEELDWGWKGFWFEPYRRRRRCVATPIPVQYQLELQKISMVTGLNP